MQNKLVRRLAALCLAVGLVLSSCAAPDAAEDAQAADGAGTPTLHFRDSELAAEVVYTEDPLEGDFADMPLAAEGSDLPDGTGIVLLQNGYDLVPCSDGAEIITADWYYPEDAAGGTAPIVRYVFFSCQALAADPSAGQTVEFDIVEIDPAFWTEVTVHDPQGLGGWVLVDINDPGRVLASAETAEALDGGDQRAWVFETAALNDPAQTGVGLCLPEGANAVPEICADWQVEPEPDSSWQVFASGAGGKLSFTLEPAAAPES